MSQQIKLDAEEMAWYELAYLLRSPVSILKEHITVTEFLGWREFFRVQREKNEKEHFYWAQIAAEVRRSYVKEPAKVKLESFLLKTVTRSAQNRIPAQDYNPGLSKGIWMAALGMKPEVN